MLRFSEGEDRIWLTQTDGFSSPSSRGSALDRFVVRRKRMALVKQLKALMHSSCLRFEDNWTHSRRPLSCSYTPYKRAPPLHNPNKEASTHQMASNHVLQLSLNAPFTSLLLSICHSSFHTWSFVISHIKFRHFTHGACKIERHSFYFWRTYGCLKKWKHILKHIKTQRG